MRKLIGKYVGKHIFVSVLVVLFSLSSLQIQPIRAQGNTIYYAAPSPMGVGDCSAWENACDLQTALTTAVAPAEIWVKAGVHKPTIVPDSRDAAFTLRSGVEVYGGFAGTETAREQRDWRLNLTILSGDIDNNDINEDGNFIIEDVVEIVGANSRHVVVGSGVDATSILDGLVITAGKDAGVTGAGILLVGGSTPIFRNLLISGNYAGTGGGLNIDGSGPTIVNTIFAHNFAEYRGGGMNDSVNINTTLINCEFYDNVSRDNHGAAIMTGYSKLTGGVLKIINTLFHYNYTPYAVAGIFADNTNVQLYNVTFSENISGGEPAAVLSYQSTWTVANVIVWGNHSPGGIEFQYVSSSNINILNSDIAACGASGATWHPELCGSDGGGNIQADPLFVNPGLGNFRLGQSSLAVDAGNNAFVPVGITTDLDCNARFVDMPVPDTGLGTPPIVDMGVYEAYEDAAAPTVSSITARDPNPTNANHVRFLVNFSEPVFGVSTESFDLSSIGLTGTNIESVTGGPVYWVVTVNTGEGDGSLRLDVPEGAEVWDLMGNALTGLPYQGGASYVIDRTQPEVLSSTRANPNPINTYLVNFDVTFSETVTGADTSDFELSVEGGISGASIYTIYDFGDHIRVAVLTGSGDGTIRLDVVEEAEIADLAGNPIAGLPYTEGEAYTIDKTRPTVLSILRADPNPTRELEVDYTVTFSEAVSGVGVPDFVVTGFGGNTGASVLSVSGSGDSYVVTVSTGTGGGRLRLDIPYTAIIWDAANNWFEGYYTSGEEYTVLYFDMFLPQLSK